VTVNSRRRTQTIFYRLQEQELRWLKTNKLINNTSYIYFALKIENPFCDQPIKIKVKEFALHWGIPESSIYECIAKLKELESINIQTKEIVISWRSFSQQEGLSDNPESLQDSRIDSEIPEITPGNQNGFQDSRINSEIPEQSIYKDRVRDQTVTDFIQTDSNPLSDREGEEPKIVKAEIVKEDQALPPSLAAKTIQASKQESNFSCETNFSGRGDNNIYLEWLLQEYDAGRITTLPKDELVLLAGEVIGDCVGVYRRSGRILASSRNDIDKTFLRFAADKHCRGDLQNADAMIVNWEKTPESWRKLVGLVETWQQNLDKPVAQMTPKQAKAAEMYARLQDKYGT